MSNIAPKKKHQYVKNADLIEALKIYKAEKAAGRNGIVYTKAYNLVGEATLLIAGNLIKNQKFSGYPRQIKEEMVSDAIENVCMYIDNFDPEFSGGRTGQVNAFGYITQICWYAFLRRIAKEKKQLKLKAMLIQQSGIIDSIDTRQEGDDRQYANEYLDALKAYQDYMDDEPAPVKVIKGPSKKKSKKDEPVEGLAAIFDEEESQDESSEDTE